MIPLYIWSFQQGSVSACGFVGPTTRGLVPSRVPQCSRHSLHLYFFAPAWNWCFAWTRIQFLVLDLLVDTAGDVYDVNVHVLSYEVLGLHLYLGKDSDVRSGSWNITIVALPLPSLAWILGTAIVDVKTHTKQTTVRHVEAVGHGLLRVPATHRQLPPRNGCSKGRSGSNGKIHHVPHEKGANPGKERGKILPKAVENPKEMQLDYQHHGNHLLPWLRLELHRHKSYSRRIRHLSNLAPQRWMDFYPDSKPISKHKGRKWCRKSRCIYNSRWPHRARTSSKLLRSSK